MEHHADSIQDIVAFAGDLKPEDLTWKPIYANNILTNPLEGFYALVLLRDGKGEVSGRKYSIVFQYKQNERGSITEEIEYYILFEKHYPKVTGALDYPAPTPPRHSAPWDSPDTFSHYGVNDYGSFIRVFRSMEEAKRRAARQFRMVYGFAFSHLLGDEDREE